VARVKVTVVVEATGATPLRESCDKTVTEKAVPAETGEPPLTGEITESFFACAKPVVNPMKTKAQAMKMRRLE
jgi:hypothetical protein